MTDLAYEKQALRDKIAELKRIMVQFEHLVNNYEEDNDHVVEYTGRVN